MKLSLLYHTLGHLRLRQMVYQLKYRLHKPRYTLFNAQKTVVLKFHEWIVKQRSLKGNEFSFLNLSDTFISWNYAEHGMLWAYNLNYMDWLLQEDMSFEEGAKWIDKFIDEIPENKIGLDAYPIALRGINWIKFISKYQDEIDENRLRKWNDSLYSQYVLLTKKLEYHLLGNHLLEDAYSLFIASIYFCNSGFYKVSSKLLRQELDEQILPDGAHYEQSPMYHCILLDRLLDCCNFSFANLWFEEQDDLNNLLRNKVEMMLGHLDSICYSDGTIPLLNDSANGVAPTPKELKDYALRLGIEWQSIDLKDCGYRKMQNDIFEAIVDIGNVMASYQPGHTHADTFNYELRVNGKPFVIDTGISTYNKTERRQEERGTTAHNTVTIDGQNSSEVWGGFRVGKRAKVTAVKDSCNAVEALHDGFGKFIHTRKFTLSDNVFSVKDSVNPTAKAVSYIRLDPSVHIISYDKQLVETNISIIKISGASEVQVIDCHVSAQYNVFLLTKAIKIVFENCMSYTVSGNISF